MPHRVTRSPEGQYSLVLSDEPPYCVALEAAPPARELELSTGLWLVMVFAVWSAPDVAAIQTALDAARHFGGRVKLGVRPFHDWEEHETWCPGLGEDGSSPIWLLLRDGAVIELRRGLVSLTDLVQSIEAVIRPPSAA